MELLKKGFRGWNFIRISFWVEFSKWNFLGGIRPERVPG